jgi:ankyrin repeat protein
MLSVMKGGRTSLIEWMLSQYPWLSQAGLADRSPDWRLNDHGYVTPIGIASQLNRIDWIEIFLRSDADFDDVIDHAMHHRSLPLIKALVEWAKEFQEVSPAKDYLGRIEYGMGGKALRYALQGDPLPMETLLGVHPLKDFSVFRNQMAFIEGWNTKNRLLSLAIEHRSIEWIDRLLDAGAELNVKAPAPSYAFPLRSASWTNDRALVSHLLDRGADPFIVLYESHSDKKPVTFVDDVAKQGHESIRELLIERGLISPEDRRHKQGLVSAFKAKKARIMKALISQDESSFEQELKFFDLNCFSLIEWKGIAFEAEAGSRSEPLMFWIATYRAAWALRILAKDHAWRNYLINKESVVIYDNQIGQLGVLDSAGNSFLHGLFAWPEDEARAGWEILKAVAYENRKYGQYGDWKGGVGRGISHSLFMQPNKAGITPVDLVFAKGWDFLLSDPVFYSQWRISKKEDKFCAEFLSDATGKTLLHQVVSLGDLARLEFYLRQIPEAVDSPDVYGRTPLMWAAERANRAVVRCLLNAGANPALVDRDRRNLMHFVGSKNTEEHEALFAELIATLPLPVLRQKSDLEGTPLFQAIIHGWVRAAERLEILLGSREVRRKCRDGRSILHCCVLSRALKIKGLFEHYLALYAKDPSGIDVCPVPKHSGFIRESSLQSITPLMLAAQLGRAEWFLLLLQHGANPLKKMRAQDAFSFAVFANTPEMTEIVCRHDLLRKTENLAVRLWFVGVLSGNRLILEQFLLAGFFINQQDEGIGHGDENALHYAANRGHTAIAAFLVAGGIDRHLKNRAGETPRDLAKKQGYWGVVKVIGGGSDGLC